MPRKDVDSAADTPLRWCDGDAPMSRAREMVRSALMMPVRVGRMSEFVFRRSDAAWDVFPDDDPAGTVPGSAVDRV